MDPTKILAGLNPEQKKAAAHRGPAVLILAGAGSGKTRVLTHRIAHLVATGDARPDEILALTFTNKAAREMRERAEKLLAGLASFSNSPIPSLADAPLLTTFHSFCARVLRAEARAGDYPDFAIADSDDLGKLIKKIAREQEIDSELFPPAKIRGAISRAKNDGIGLREFEIYAEEKGDFPKVVAKIWRELEERKTASGLLDFDDLMLETVAFFRDRPDRIAAYRGRFRHILVDEWQDTNKIQYALIRLLAPTGQNLAAVGDDDQSIYAFRGAASENLAGFEKDFPGTRVVKLEQNYRSTKRILAAANKIIARNENRRDKKLWTAGADGPKIEILRGFTGDDEARRIAERIADFREKTGLSWADFAVLYRANFLSREIEEAFLNAGIPYKIVGGLKFYERKEIKDVLAYLRLLENPRDEASFLRIVNVPARKIGAGALDKLREAAGNEPPFPFLLAGGADKIPGAAGTALKNFVQIFSPYFEEKNRTVSEILKGLFSRSGLEEMLADDKDRTRNVSELFAIAERYDGRDDGLAEFLNDVALATDQVGDETGETVTLSSLHSAKGLEWPVVFIAGCEDGLLPHENARADAAGLAEERRLMYVGITRAREKLFLSFARERYFFGQRKNPDPSPYLREIPPDCLLRTLDEIESPRGFAGNGGGRFSQFGGKFARDFDDGDGGDWGA